MRNIIPLLHCFSTANIACIQAQILRMLFIWLRAWHYDMIQRFFQQFDIMRICPGNNDCQRKPFLIRQNTAFCPHFFLGPLGFSQRTPKPRVLLSYNHPGSATPNQFLPAHRTVPDPCSRSSRRNQLPTILETFCAPYCRFRIHGAVPSIGSRSEEHRRFLPALFSLTLVSGLGQEHFCIPLMDLVLLGVFRP